MSLNELLLAIGSGMLMLMLFYILWEYGKVKRELLKLKKKELGDKE